MSHYKFTRRGGLALFSDFAWPLPAAGRAGAWVEVSGPLQPCRHGLHVCRREDLPYWLHDQLWQVEVEGPSLPAHDGQVVGRARLLRPVDAWPDVQRSFADQCVARVEERSGRGHTDARLQAYLSAASQCAQGGNVLVAAYASALAFTCFAPPEQADAAFRAERRQQALLLSAALQLE